MIDTRELKNIIKAFITTLINENKDFEQNNSFDEFKLLPVRPNCNRSHDCLDPVKIKSRKRKRFSGDSNPSYKNLAYVAGERKMAISDLENLYSEIEAQPQPEILQVWKWYTKFNNIISLTSTFSTPYNNLITRELEHLHESLKDVQKRCKTGNCNITPKDVNTLKLFEAYDSLYAEMLNEKISNINSSVELTIGQFRHQTISQFMGIIESIYALQETVNDHVKSLVSNLGGVDYKNKVIHLINSYIEKFNVAIRSLDSKLESVIVDGRNKMVKWEKDIIEKLFLSNITPYIPTLNTPDPGIIELQIQTLPLEESNIVREYYHLYKYSISQIVEIPRYKSSLIPISPIPLYEYKELQGNVSQPNSTINELINVNYNYVKTLLDLYLYTLENDSRLLSEFITCTNSIYLKTGNVSESLNKCLLSYYKDIAIQRAITQSRVNKITTEYNNKFESIVVESLNEKAIQALSVITSPKDNLDILSSSKYTKIQEFNKSIIDLDHEIDKLGKLNSEILTLNSLESKAKFINNPDLLEDVETLHSLKSNSNTKGGSVQYNIQNLESKVDSILKNEINENNNKINTLTNKKNEIERLKNLLVSSDIESHKSYYSNLNFGEEHGLDQTQIRSILESLNETINPITPRREETVELSKYNDLKNSFEETLSQTAKHREQYIKLKKEFSQCRSKAKKLNSKVEQQSELIETYKNLMLKDSNQKSMNQKTLANLHSLQSNLDSHINDETKIRKIELELRVLDTKISNLILANANLDAKNEEQYNRYLALADDVGNQILRMKTLVKKHKYSPDLLYSLDQILESRKKLIKSYSEVRSNTEYLGALIQQNANLKQQMETLEANIRDSDHSDTQILEIEELSKNLQSMERDSLAKFEQYMSLKLEHDELIKQTTNLQQENLKLKLLVKETSNTPALEQRLVENKKLINTLKNRISSVGSVLNQANYNQALMKQFDAIISRHVNNNAKALEYNLMSLNQNHNKQQHNLQLLNSKLQALIENKKEHRNEYDTLKDQLITILPEKLKTEFEKFENISSEALDQCSKLSLMYGQSMAAREQNNREISELLQYNQILNNNIKELELGNSNLQHELNSLNVVVDKQNDEIEYLKTRALDLESQRKEFEDKIISLQKVIQGDSKNEIRIKELMQQLHVSNAKLERELSRRKTHKKMFHGEYSPKEYENYISEIEQQVAIYKSEKNELELKLKEQQQTIESLNEQMATHQSTSESCQLEQQQLLDKYNNLYNEYKSSITKTEAPILSNDLNDTNYLQEENARLRSQLESVNTYKNIPVLEYLISLKTLAAKNDPTQGTSDSVGLITAERRHLEKKVVDLSYEVSKLKEDRKKLEQYKESSKLNYDSQIKLLQTELQELKIVNEQHVQMLGKYKTFNDMEIDKIKSLLNVKYDKESTWSTAQNRLSTLKKFIAENIQYLHQEIDAISAKALSQYDNVNYYKHTRLDPIYGPIVEQFRNTIRLITLDRDRKIEELNYYKELLAQMNLDPKLLESMWETKIDNQGYQAKLEHLNNEKEKYSYETFNSKLLLDRIDKEILNVTKQLDQGESKFESLSKIYDTKVQMLTKELDILKNSKLNLARKNETLLNENLDLNARLNTQAKVLSTLSSQESTPEWKLRMQNYISELETDNSKMRILLGQTSDSVALSHEIETLRSQLDETKEELKQIQNAKQEIQSQFETKINSLESENLDLVNKLSSSHSTVEDLGVKLENSMAKLQELNSLYSTVLQSNEQNIIRIEDLESINQKLKFENVNLNQYKSNNDLEKLNKLAKTYASKIQKLDAENEHLKQIIDDRDKALESLQKKHTNLGFSHKSQLTTISNLKKNLNRERELLNSEIQTLTKQYNLAQENYTDLFTRFENAKLERISTNQKNEFQANTIGELLAEIKEYKQTIDDLNAKNLKLNETIHEQSILIDQKEIQTQQDQLNITNLESLINTNHETNLLVDTLSKENDKLKLVQDQFNNILNINAEASALDFSFQALEQAQYELSQIDRSLGSVYKSYMETMVKLEKYEKELTEIKKNVKIIRELFSTIGLDVNESGVITSHPNITESEFKDHIINNNFIKHHIQQQLSQFEESSKKASIEELNREYEKVSQLQTSLEHEKTKYNNLLSKYNLQNYYLTSVMGSDIWKVIHRSNTTETNIKEKENLNKIILAINNLIYKMNTLENIDSQDYIEKFTILNTKLNNSLFKLSNTPPCNVNSDAQEIQSLNQRIADTNLKRRQLNGAFQALTPVRNTECYYKNGVKICSKLQESLLNETMGTYQKLII